MHMSEKVCTTHKFIFYELTYPKKMHESRKRSCLMQIERRRTEVESVGILQTSQSPAEPSTGGFQELNVANPKNLQLHNIAKL